MYCVLAGVLKFVSTRVHKYLIHAMNIYIQKNIYLISDLVCIIVDVYLKANFNVINKLYNLKIHITTNF